VTTSLALYRIGTALLEPLAPLLVQNRIKSGKERPERAGERFGRSKLQRPPGVLLWMHGASVGESRLLLELFDAIRQRRPDAHALVTTQTTTSADMIAAKPLVQVVHQMAPVDGPAAVERFLEHWKPDAAVFAEGEIWPNMLLGLKRASVPAALANARMTTKTLASWNGRKPSAREIFAAFGFIGAADRQTAEGLRAATGRTIATVGNLKMAARVTPPPHEPIEKFVTSVDRPVLLAASTHPGEDAFALDAFAIVRRTTPEALLIIVPRHPDRAASIMAEARGRGHAVQQWSANRTPPARDVDVLVADTMGELLVWYAVSNGVYLGGATNPDIGGHNAIEPAQLGKRVFTGPHGFNFRETFDILAAHGALAEGAQPADLAAFWQNELASGSAQRLPPNMVETFRAPFERTVEAIIAMLPPEAAGDA
jgi:3-deoxy-D-manno-octulosonic-acid transferase